MNLKGDMFVNMLLFYIAHITQHATSPFKAGVMRRLRIYEYCNPKPPNHKISNGDLLNIGSYDYATSY